MLLRVGVFTLLLVENYRQHQWQWSPVNLFVPGGCLQLGHSGWPKTNSLARAVEMGYSVERTWYLALRSIGRLAGATMISQ
jgi:hypothetical protein